VIKKAYWLSLNHLLPWFKELWLFFREITIMCFLNLIESNLWKSDRNNHEWVIALLGQLGFELKTKPSQSVLVITAIYPHIEDTLPNGRPITSQQFVLRGIV
jgi:hypothetical protein